MPERREPGARRSSSVGIGRLPRFRDIAEVSDEMIAFVEKYQQVWASESKATLAFGEFLGARAESLRNQVELMRLGTDAFRRYTAWSDALLDLRPDRFMRAWLSELEQRLEPKSASGGGAAVEEQP